MKLHRHIVASCLLAFELWPTVVRADVPTSPTAPPFELEWQAPEECPSADDVRERVERLLRDASSQAHANPISVHATVTRREAAWRVSLETGGEAGRRHRVLEGATCEGLADATALIIALMIDPQAALAQTQQTAQPAKAVNVPPPKPAPRAPQKPSAASKPRPARWFGGISASADVGVLPEPSLSVVVSVGVKGAFRGELDGAYSINHPVAYADAEQRAGGRFSLARLALVGCYAPGTRISFGPCAGLELGSMRGEAFGVDREGSGHAVWSAASVGPLLAWNIGSTLTVPLHLDAVFPLSRPHFALDRVSENLFRTAAISGRVMLGLELSF